MYYSFWLVVIQSYESEADNEYVIRGNSVVMKCEIPSYVADFVFVDLWLDSEGRNYYPNNAEETGTWPDFFALVLSGPSKHPLPISFSFYLTQFTLISPSCPPVLPDTGHRWVRAAWQLCHIKVPGAFVCGRFHRCRGLDWRGGRWDSEAPSRRLHW